MRRGGNPKALSERFNNATALKLLLVGAFILTVLSVLNAVDNAIGWREMLNNMREVMGSGNVDYFFDIEEYRRMAQDSIVSSVMLCIVPAAWTVILGWKYNKMRKDPLYAMDEKLKVQDERNLIIVDRAKAKAFDFLLSLLIATFAVYSLILVWHPDHTRYAPWVFTGVIFATMLYFSIMYKKYQKEM